MRNYIFFAVLSLILIGCSNANNGDLIFVEPDTDDNFEYPYFLFVPNQVSQNGESYIIIQPNNSGFADDNLQRHIEKAKRTASIDFYLGNYLSRHLKYPLLVPVFPRPKSEWRIYTHALDRDVMLQKNNSMERIDKQLIEMFKDAQKRLANKNIKTHDKFLLTGFSASGTFANRFTLLHPNRVFAVAAGGLNGLLMLPLDSLDNELLKYPIGVGDFKALTNGPFEKQAFFHVPQFYFMGQLDNNDAVPYDDAFDQGEREEIYKLLGKQMQPERWNNCIQIYKALNVNATFKTYEEVGHKIPEMIKKDVINFFRESIKKQRPTMSVNTLKEIPNRSALQSNPTIDMR